MIYQRMGRRDDALEQHQGWRRSISGDGARELPRVARAVSLGRAPDVQGQLSDDDVRTFLTVREDPEPLYFWAGDLVYCGYTAPALTLLRESIRRNYCAVSAIEIDPMFAAIRNNAGYGELLGAARACRTRFRDHVRAKTRTP